MVIGLGALLILAAVVCGIIILVDAFKNETWKGLLGLFVHLYLLYYAIVEFDHDYKWLIVICWLICGSLGYFMILFGSGAFSSAG